MSEHTPGPWTVDDTYNEPSYVIDAAGFPVAEVDEEPILIGWRQKVGGAHWAEKPGVAYIVRPLEEVAANARLIAAAPDLLAALEGIVADDSKLVSLADQRSRWNERMDAARAALSKARATEGAAPDAPERPDA